MMASLLTEWSITLFNISVKPYWQIFTTFFGTSRMWGSIRNRQTVSSDDEAVMPSNRNAISTRFRSSYRRALVFPVATSNPSSIRRRKYRLIAVRDKPNSSAALRAVESGKSSTDLRIKSRTAGFCRLRRVVVNSKLQNYQPLDAEL